jgi:hypothetical protein
MAAAISLGLLGCTDQDNPKGKTPPGVAGEANPFHDHLLKIARSYEGYGRLDEEAGWAPLLCADIGWEPPTVQPPSPTPPQFSAAGDSRTHGRKLYWLFVKNPSEYPPQEVTSPVGQVVVKEAWLPEQVDDKAPRKPVIRKVRVGDGATALEREESFIPYLRRDGHFYHAAEKASLFIMFKLDPKTPGTDEGWVYGTVSADGKRVNSAGRVESCMRCHKDAPHDRLFGRSGD